MTLFEKRLWLTIAVVAGTGCSLTPPPRYGFVVYNRLGEQIDDCELQWGSHRDLFGVIPANGESAIFACALPFPKRAVVRYRSADGTPREVVAKVSAAPNAERLDGASVCFILYPDRTLHVDLVAVDERNRRYDLVAGDGPKYIVATCNDTNEKITAMEVRFGEYLVNGEQTTESKATDSSAGWRFAHGLPYPLTRQARVSWRTRDGRQRKTVVELADLPENLDNRVLAFRFGETVELEVISWEAARDAALRKRPR